MNRRIIGALIICIFTALPAVSALSMNDAIDHGEQFIRSHAAIGTQGIVFDSYNITALTFYYNDERYRVLYKVESQGKSRFIMLEMSKEGEMKKIYLSELTKQRPEL